MKKVILRPETGGPAGSGTGRLLTTLWQVLDGRNFRTGFLGFSGYHWLVIAAAARARPPSPRELFAPGILRLTLSGTGVAVTAVVCW